MGCMPMADARPIPWTPREVVNTMEAEKDEAARDSDGWQADVAARPGRSVLGIVPITLIDINKRLSKINRRTSNTSNCSEFTHTLGLRSD